MNYSRIIILVSLIKTWRLVLFTALAILAIKFLKGTSFENASMFPLFIFFVLMLIKGYIYLNIKSRDSAHNNMTKKLANLGLKADYTFDDYAIDATNKKLIIIDNGNLIELTSKDIRGISSYDKATITNNTNHIIELKTNSLDNPLIYLNFGTSQNSRKLWFERLGILFNLKSY